MNCHKQNMSLKIFSMHDIPPLHFNNHSQPMTETIKS